MPERLTPEQIKKKYPDQWVALTDVDFKPGSLVNFYTAVVVCGMSSGTYHQKRLQFNLEGKDYLYLRTSDPVNFVGTVQ